MESEQTVQLEPQYTRFDVEIINTEIPSETITPNNTFSRPGIWGRNFIYSLWFLGTSESSSNISKPKINLTQYFLNPNQIFLGAKKHVLFVLMNFVKIYR